MKRAILTILINLIVYVIYIGLSSYFLTNRSGGGDIAFTMFAIIFMAIHLIISLMIALLKKNLIQIYVMLFLIIMSIILYNPFLDLMRNIFLNK